MLSLVGFAAYYVGGSPFSPNKIGQYLYLLVTGSGFALLVLVMKYEQEFTGTNHVIAFYASN